MQIALAGILIVKLYPISVFLQVDLAANNLRHSPVAHVKQMTANIPYTYKAINSQSYKSINHPMGQLLKTTNHLNILIIRMHDAQYLHASI